MLVDSTLRVHSLTYAPNINGTLGRRNFTSLFVYPNFPGPFHSVIVLPDADGRNSFEDGKAVALARQGYAALAADMRISSENDNELDARTILLDQFLLAFHEVRRLPFVSKVGDLLSGVWNIPGYHNVS